MYRALRVLPLVVATATPVVAARADGLSGSPSSMVHQHQIALSEDYSFLRTSKDVRKLAKGGALVTVTDGPNLTLSKVSYPYARPEVRDFVERFAARYREATGSPLVVTSLTRPASAQPQNAHKLSVHPAGMAVDLRVPADAEARVFLEKSLLEMERAGVLDVTRERSPAHYHVAVFAEAYTPYAAREDSLATIERARRSAQEATAAAAAAASALANAPALAPDSALADILLGALALLAVLAPVAYRMWSVGRVA
jgi:hypothetical protein